jgi:hypothetical protein
MFVTYLYAEDLDAPSRASPIGTPDRTTMNPCWDDIERAIRRLDGDRRSTVLLGNGPTVGDAGGHCLGIGGGGDGFYFCSLQEDEGEFVLTDPSRPTETTRRMLVGQASDHSERQCVDLAMVLKAARTFAESGQRDRSLVWDDGG